MVTLFRLIGITAGIILILMSLFMSILRADSTGGWLVYYEFAKGLTVTTLNEGDVSSAPFWLDNPILVDPISTGYALGGVTPDHRRFTLGGSTRTPGSAGLLQMDVYTGELNDPLQQLARDYRAYVSGTVNIIAYAPDGQWIAFVIDASAQANTYALFVTTADGDHPMLLVEANTRPEELRWSPDSRWIAYSLHNAPFSRQSDVHVIRRDGSDAHQLTDFYGCSCLVQGWSPDSQWIIFSAEDGLREPEVRRDYEFPEIYRVGVDGTPIEQLTHTGISKAFRGWSSDGQWMIFQDFDFFYTSRIFGVNLVTGEQKAFTDIAASYAVAMAGENMIIDYDMPDDDRILNIDPHTGAEVTLTPAGRLEYITESADWIYFFADSDLYRVRPDGSHRQQLTAGLDSMRIIGEIPAPTLPYRITISLAVGVVLMLPLVTIFSPGFVRRGL